MKGRSTSKSLLSQAVSDSCLQHQENIVLQQGKSADMGGDDGKKVRVVDADRVGFGLSAGRKPSSRWVLARVLHVHQLLYTIHVWEGRERVFMSHRVGEQEEGWSSSGIGTARVIHFNILDVYRLEKNVI